MTAAGRPARDGWNIGAVLQRLRPEFPDVTISKIRFLEAEGLVSPERSASGYRRFSEDDVARLRYVLATQRDHYLPLRVIKAQLDASGADRQPTPVARPLAAVDESDGTRSRLTRDEVAVRAGVGTALIGELEQYGLISADHGGLFDGDSVQVARLAAGLAGYGIEPRHLRAFRAAADREANLVEQVVAPMYLQRDPAAWERADRVVGELGAATVGLHSLLVKASLRRMTTR